MGGASRWSGHLDDMPVAGWGYGAPANNRIADFQALLYGHMATYQSRGTFHSTEQLSSLGEGLYREFLNWGDPPPPLDGAAPAGAAGTAAGPQRRRLRDATHGPPPLTYYGAENDVSFCIVTEVLAARLTRWQLVFEDSYRPMSTPGGGRSPSGSVAGRRGAGLPPTPASPWRPRLSPAAPSHTTSQCRPLA